MPLQPTRSQTKILRLLNQRNQEMSAQDLYVALRKAQSPLGLATVYRALEALKLSGAVQARLLNTGETLYSLTQIDRHHLTCLQCGASVAIGDDECPVHDLESQLRASAQFEIYYHTLEFFGICSPCQLQQPTSDS